MLFVTTKFDTPRPAFYSSYVFKPVNAVSAVYKSNLAVLAKLGPAFWGQLTITK